MASDPFSNRRLAAWMLAGLTLSLPSPNAVAQGCIASRGTGMTPGHCDVHGSGEESHATGAGWQATVGYRWLHSDRMFSGDVEQTQRQAEGSQEINDSNFVDLGITYVFNPRFSLTGTLPFSVQDRSQVVRAVNLQRTILGRFHTSSAGLGDARVEGNAWILNPETHMNGNVLLGLGVAAPTGDRDVQDNFKIPSGLNPKTQVHAVDQSIQLGNGGWGITLDLYAYRQLIPRLNAFLNASYTLTPDEKYSPTASLVGDYSIADSYLARGGFEFVLWPRYSVVLSLGGRIDGVPIHDFVGGSEGFRRPGYSVSIEPGINVMTKGWTVSVNTPIALYRNRQQSLSEQAAGIAPIAAGFADLIVTCSISKRF